MSEGSTKSGKVRSAARRGKARFVGLGLGFVVAALPAVASAGGQFERTSQLWFVNINGQNFNVIEPICLWFMRGGG